MTRRAVLAVLLLSLIACKGQGDGEGGAGGIACRLVRLYEPEG